MQIFGSGVLFARPLTDYAGTAIANPTPVPFGVLQNVGVDISREIKMLHGASQFPVAVGAGKGKFSLKAEFGDIAPNVWGQLFAGRSQTAALVALLTADPIVGAASVTTTPPSSGVFVNDLGLTYAATGARLVRVAAAPTVGQYTVSGAGTYVFNATDNGVAFLRNYEYSVASMPGHSQFALSNDAMGTLPTFSLKAQSLYKGQRLVLSLNSCVAPKLGMSFKNDDFNIPNLDIEALDNGSGSLGTLTISELA